jgi:hypothetical protein
MIVAFASPSSSLLAEFWVSFVAMLGGIVVFVGLLLEKIAERGNDKHSPPFLKPYNRIGECGWKILMAGIVIEIAVAGISAKVDLETRQMAIKNDPLNQPITSMSASIKLWTTVATSTNRTGRPPAFPFPKKTRSLDVDGSTVTLDCFTPWLKNGKYVSFSHFSLVADDFAIVPTESMQGAVVLIQFHPRPAKRIEETAAGFGGEKVGVVNEINRFDLYVSWTLKDGIIYGGTLTLVANSTSRDFLIPPQKFSDRITIVASNAIPETEK